MGSFIDEGATMASFFVEEHTLPVRLAVFVDLTSVKFLILNLLVSDEFATSIDSIMVEWNFASHENLNTFAQLFNRRTLLPL